MKKLIVTGGAGFIGSHFVDLALKNNCQVAVLDKLTYAGDQLNLKQCEGLAGFSFHHGDIGDLPFVKDLIKKIQPDAILNFAAESHVDNSISGPQAFMETNILGTFFLLEAARDYFANTLKGDASRFKYLQISTDEVFGDLKSTGHFTEATSYNPHSPYSASKASADHLVRAWKRTYGLPTLVTNCSNNYGPRQYPEKLIPHVLIQAINNKPLPVYGDGGNVRDWIHVTDHAYGVWLALTQGKAGDTFCFGGRSERTNLQVVQSLCSILDEIKPRSAGSYKDLITFVKDRPGHDWRYAIDDSKAESVLQFKRQFTSFENGLKNTIGWYLENSSWTESILTKKQKSPSI